MATPHVASIAGLLKSHYPNLSASRIESLLTQSASNVPEQATTGILEAAEVENDAINAAEAKVKQLINLDTLDGLNKRELKYPQSVTSGAARTSARTRLNGWFKKLSLIVAIMPI